MGPKNKAADGRLRPLTNPVIFLRGFVLIGFVDIWNLLSSVFIAHPTLEETRAIVRAIFLMFWAAAAKERSTVSSRRL